MAVGSIASQTTVATFLAPSIKVLNDAVGRAQNCPERGLSMHALHERSLRNVVFADASFANNVDFATQLGFMIIRCDQTSRASCLHYTSYKSKCVVRSTHGGDLYAWADGYDFAFLLRHNLATIFSKWFALILLTDGMSLCNLLIHTSTVSTEKRLMIDISDLREALEHKAITEIGWARSLHNGADAMNTPGNCASLDSFCNRALYRWMWQSGCCGRRIIP